MISFLKGVSFFVVLSPFFIGVDPFMISSLSFAAKRSPMLKSTFSFSVFFWGENNREKTLSMLFPHLSYFIGVGFGMGVFAI